MDNPYHQTDDTVERWAKHHGFVLVTRHDGHDLSFRNIYLGSGDECCQIWVDPPQDDIVEVHAAAVESRNDEEMRMDWASPVPALSETLEQAVAHVRAWFAREQIGSQA